MKVDLRLGMIWPVALLALVLVIANALLQIPSGEGFNPSDDGVVLAQSYRLLQGEVPHRDFISIRPVGSAVMHLVHFFSPLPLVLSSRWAVLAEYFLISLLFALAWIPFSSRPRPGIGGWALAGLVLFQFLLTESHYNLFPWTTVDALFWSGVALLAWSRLEANPERRVPFKLFVLFFGVTAAALCRQTFLLPGLVLAIAAGWKHLIRGSGGQHPLVSWPAVVAGTLPGWVYAGILTVTGSWGDFIRQMTGRTEFWETGVRKFSDNFWGTPAWAAFAAVLATGLLIRWADDDRRLISIGQSILSTLRAAIMISVLLVSMAVFLVPAYLFAWSFGLFWLLLLQLILLKINPSDNRPQTSIAWWTLLIAWTSSLSLGDNAPVFATGILAGAGIILYVESAGAIGKVARPAVVGILVGAFLLGLTLVSFRAQKRNNYRDLPAARLEAPLGELYPGLKGIRSNPALFDYMSEIRAIYEKLGSPAGRFAVWPNNALVYALLDSPNPFPLDWMQAAEYPGSEERLYEEIGRVMGRGEYFILLERYNVKWIVDQRIPVGLESADHPYLGMMEGWAVEWPLDSRWFRLFISRK
ncbi:MAG: hypothetical protein R6V75_05510 [Bacteroidales bacterium]